MPVVTAHVHITRPPGEVFAFAADRRNRGRMLPDNFTRFRLLTDTATGTGARFAFTLQTDRGAYDSVTELVDYQPPVRFAEETVSGDFTYHTDWRFAAHEDGTAVVAETRYPPPAGWLDRLLDRFIGRRAVHHSLLVELVRLKQLIEDPPPSPGPPSEEIGD